MTAFIYFSNQLKSIGKMEIGLTEKLKFSLSVQKNPFLTTKMFKRFKKEIRSIVTMRATVAPGPGQSSPLERSEIRKNKRIVLDKIDPSSLILRATPGKKPVIERVEARKN